MAGILEEDPLALALAGGEDYELLFTVSAEDVDAFEKALVPLKLKATRIGKIVKDSKRRAALDDFGKEMSPARFGYDHLAGVMD